MSSSHHSHHHKKPLENGLSFDFRLRFEKVNDPQFAVPAEALTLRTLVNYRHKISSNWAGVATLEDNQALLGIEQYSVPITGYKKAQYPIIIEPQHTEWDQLYLEYQAPKTRVRLGRQQFTANNQRLIGDLAWRGDRQTFDGVSTHSELGDNTEITALLSNKRNRVFARDGDIKSDDRFLNVKHTMANSRLMVYALWLDETDTAIAINSLGVRFEADTLMGDSSLGYVAEYAVQEYNGNNIQSHSIQNHSIHSHKHSIHNPVNQHPGHHNKNRHNKKYNADYFHLSVVKQFGDIQLEFGVERLGTDNGNYGFSTPLASLHMFNGAADQFMMTPKTGLLDRYVAIQGQWGDGEFELKVHDFDSVEGIAGMQGMERMEDNKQHSDYGTEYDIQYRAKLKQGHHWGVKYANYQAQSWRFNSEKFWLWLSFGF